MLSGVCFKNFAVTAELSSYANVCLARVMDLAPDGAAVSAVIEQSGDRYFGKFEVYSARDHFYVTASGADARLGLDRMMEKMQDRLEKWHSRRFYARTGEAPLLTQ